MTEIYYKSWCPFSVRALKLLDRKGAPYTAIDVTDDPEREREMRERSGSTTVPQIFIDGRHVGGNDELVALNRAGELDALLGIDVRPEGPKAA